MKLYTEEQVRQAIKMADKYHHILESEEIEIVSILEPIELPSDEEIYEASIGQCTFMPSYIAGAKWMRDKIKGGNNE